jgi:hypothetical protein
MAETVLTTVGSLSAPTAADRAAIAATRLYDAEIALHIARQTGVDAWVAAAYDGLHVAICEHRAALAAAGRTIHFRTRHRERLAG